MPFAANFAAISRVATGEIVLISITNKPALAPTITPFSPSNTASTSGVSETIEITTSTFAANVAGVG